MFDGRRDVGTQSLVDKKYTVTIVRDINRSRGDVVVVPNRDSAVTVERVARRRRRAVSSLEPHQTMHRRHRRRDLTRHRGVVRSSWSFPPSPQMRQATTNTRTIDGRRNDSERGTYVCGGSTMSYLTRTRKKLFASVLFVPGGNWVRSLRRSSSDAYPEK